jgi:peptide/nickel transport system ATP-binding protein
LLAAVPYPDLARPLNFETLQLNGASDPLGWSNAFRDRGGGVEHHHLCNDHYVLACRKAELEELRS